MHSPAKNPATPLGSYCETCKKQLWYFPYSQEQNPKSLLKNTAKQTQSETDTKFPTFEHFLQKSFAIATTRIQLDTAELLIKSWDIRYRCNLEEVRPQPSAVRFLPDNLRQNLSNCKNLHQILKKYLLTRAKLPCNYLENKNSPITYITNVLEPALS
jgi:hypothetical protein